MKAATTMEELDALDQDLILKGYRAGLDDAPDYTQKSQSYWHGYLNAEVDRGKCPISKEQQELARAYIERQKSGKHI